LRGVRAFREIAGAGHAICQEQPAEIARVIKKVADSEASAHA